MRFGVGLMGCVGAVLAVAACSPATVARLAARPLGGRITSRTAVPILMYHVLARAPRNAAYPELYVAPSLFRAQMRYLAAHRYHPVTLQTVYDAWHGLGVLPPRPVVLTFDDGYESQFSIAAAALRRRRWPGVLDLTVANLRSGDLGAAMVRRMIAAGWELDSHTLTHPDLVGLGTGVLRREVAGSRRVLQRRFGVPVDFFCYPSGAFDRRVVAEVRRAGYLGATTTAEGIASPGDGLFTLDRIRVDAGETPAALGRALLAAPLPA